MTRQVAIPQASDDLIAVALKDPAVMTRLGNAARAFLGKRAAELTLAQRTADAEAIIQEAASRAWKRRDHFDGSSDGVRWLVGFVIKVAQEFAKERCRGMTSHPAQGPGLEELAVDPARPVEDVLADKLLASHLLTRLPSIEQNILRMHFFGEMTCAEIGQKVDMSENAVRVRMFRAIRKLRDLCGVTGEGQP